MPALTLRTLDLYGKLRALSLDTAAGGEGERAQAAAKCKEMEAEYPSIRTSLEVALRALENPFADAFAGAGGTKRAPAADVAPWEALLLRAAERAAVVGERKLEKAIDEAFGDSPNTWEPLEAGKIQVRAKDAPNGRVWIEVRAWRKDLTDAAVDRVLGRVERLLGG